MSGVNPIAWNLTDLPDVPKVGIRVMSTFACGGGSSMGYKLAGCDVIAANDIDPEMAWHYKANLAPANYFLCPIRDLLTATLPQALADLDILDGSPPCSTFSTAGLREDSWGKDKHFREGQAKQVLSDLFFDYLDVAERLRPKVCIAENVKGMLLGNAKGYTRMVMERFKAIGYRPQLFLVNAADCGVPQRRERVFFVALRDDLAGAPLRLAPRHRWVTSEEATSGLALTDAEIRECAATGVDQKFWRLTKPGDDYRKAVRATEGRDSLFQHCRLDGSSPACTLSANAGLFTHWTQCRKLSFREWKRLGSFPDDYIARTPKLGKYLIGMSVPPRMAQAVAAAVLDQWL